MAAQRAARAVGQFGMDRACGKSGIDPVEYLVKSGGEQACERTRLYTEPLPRIEQHIAPRAPKLHRSL